MRGRSRRYPDPSITLLGVFDGILPARWTGVCTVALTNRIVREARPREKPYKLADMDGHLLVQPNGRRLWRWNYRYLNKHKTVDNCRKTKVDESDTRNLPNKRGIGGSVTLVVPRTFPGIHYGTRPSLEPCSGSRFRPMQVARRRCRYWPRNRGVRAYEANLRHSSV